MTLIKFEGNEERAGRLAAALQLRGHSVFQIVPWMVETDADEVTVMQLDGQAQAAVARWEAGGCPGCGLSVDCTPEVALEKLALAGQEPPRWTPGRVVLVCVECAAAARQLADREVVRTPTLDDGVPKGKAAVAALLDGLQEGGYWRERCSCGKQFDAPNHEEKCPSCRE